MKPSKPMTIWMYRTPNDNEIHFSQMWPFWLSESEQKLSGLEPIEVEIRQIKKSRGKADKESV